MTEQRIMIYAEHGTYGGWQWHAACPCHSLMVNCRGEGLPSFLSAISWADKHLRVWHPEMSDLSEA